MAIVRWKCIQRRRKDSLQDSHRQLWLHNHVVRLFTHWSNLLTRNDCYFHCMLDNCWEDYVNNTIVKFKGVYNHVIILRKSSLDAVNPLKCDIIISSRNILRCTVHGKRINLNLTKTDIQAIEPSTTHKQWKSYIGKVSYFCSQGWAPPVAPQVRMCHPVGKGILLL